MSKAVRAFKTCYVCKRNADELAAAGLRFYSNGYCNECGARYNNDRRYSTPETHERIKGQHRAFYARHRDRALQQQKDRNRRERTLCLEHYGGKCACCGETTWEFLAIDHIDGDGNQHRKQVRGQGGKLYRWLIKNNFPDGFRVLCHNCNLSLGNYGYCPHHGVTTTPGVPLLRGRRLGKAESDREGPAS